MSNTVTLAHQLKVGDEIILDDGSIVCVRGVHPPETEWNPHTTVVRLALGSTGWHSWPASKKVTLSAGRR